MNIEWQYAAIKTLHELGRAFHSGEVAVPQSLRDEGIEHGDIAALLMVMAKHLTEEADAAKPKRK